MTPKRRRNQPGDRERQQKLRERRKADGWRRVSVWLSPEQAGRLETLGGDSWLGRTVKTLLGDALQERRPASATPPTPTVSDNAVTPVVATPDTGRNFSGTAKKEISEPITRETKAAFMAPADKAALMREVDSLLSQGLSGNDIARRWNAEGRRTVRGSPFVGQILLRDWRKWKRER